MQDVEREHARDRERTFKIQRENIQELESKKQEQERTRNRERTCKS